MLHDWYSNLVSFHGCSKSFVTCGHTPMVPAFHSYGQFSEKYIASFGTIIYSNVYWCLHVKFKALFTCYRWHMHFVVHFTRFVSSGCVPCFWFAVSFLAGFFGIQARFANCCLLGQLKMVQQQFCFGCFLSALQLTSWLNQSNWKWAF